MRATAFYIATVWMVDPDTAGTVSWVSTRHVIRLQACGPADYEAAVRALWPGKAITFGPISLSKVQTDV